MGEEYDSSAAAAAAVPCGIHVLGKLNASPATEVIAHATVRGYVRRIEWSLLEPAPNTIDFAPIEAALAALPAGQGMTLQIIGREPAHVAALATNYWHWIDPNAAHDTGCAEHEDANGQVDLVATADEVCRLPVPWDPNSLNHYDWLVAQLGSRLVFDKVANATVPLASHSALRAVMLPLPGWVRIRDGKSVGWSLVNGWPVYDTAGFKVWQLPGYTRDKLVNATVRVVRAQRAAFPAQKLIVGFWTVEDGSTSPTVSLWQNLRQRLTSATTGLMFFEENLAHSIPSGGTAVYAPAVDYAAPLLNSGASAGFQAVRPWVGATDVSSPNFGGSPVAAMDWAVATYGSKYFEIYRDDIVSALGGATTPRVIANHSADWGVGMSRLATSLCQ